MQSQHEEKYSAIKTAIKWSLAVSVLMLVGKVGAYWITGSTAILSDALESILHIVATGLAAWSVWYASQPASKQYPYGAGKIAYFSAGFEGLLIFIAALAIFAKAIEAFIKGPQLRQLDVGFVMILALGVINLFLGLYLLRVGKRENSIILKANGHHVLTDMWTSAVVLVGVGLVWLTNIPWIDPVVAILAAAQITWSASSIMRGAFQGLMEQADQTVTQEVIQLLTEAKSAGNISDFHELRHRTIQSQIWMEVHLLMPGDTTLEDAHHTASLLEADIVALFPENEVFITSHLEPDTHEDDHPDGHSGLTDPLATHE